MIFVGSTPILGVSPIRGVALRRFEVKFVVEKGI